MDTYLENLVIVQDLVMHSTPVKGKDAEIVSVIPIEQSTDWLYKHGTLTG